MIPALTMSSTAASYSVALGKQPIGPAVGQRCQSIVRQLA